MVRRSTAVAALALSALSACADPASPDAAQISPNATLRASQDGGLPVVATAKTNRHEPDHVDRGRYNITLRFLTDAASQAKYGPVFEVAAARWERIIIADEPSVTGTLPTRLCGGGAPDFTGTVDDIMIDVLLVPIDGPGKVLGSAGPCFGNANNLALHGTMRFDVADLPRFHDELGLFDEIVVHEMGHVLGIGTLWNYRRALRTAAPDYRFLGDKANVAYGSIGGEGYVPVEDLYGAGTRGAHWRESTFDNELMTGFIEANNTNPLSRVTAGSMRDLGYGSAMTAEQYQLPEPVATAAIAGTNSAAGLATDGFDITPHEELWELQAVVAPADPE